jgi:hypothetical protein
MKATTTFIAFGFVLGVFDKGTPGVPIHHAPRDDLHACMFFSALVQAVSHQALSASSNTSFQYGNLECKAN